MIVELAGADAAKSFAAVGSEETKHEQDIVRGDYGTLTNGAIIKFPDGGYSKDGPPTQEWGFRGILDVLLGTGTPAATP